MAVDCEVVLNWDTTPLQMRSLGKTLWSWCNPATGDRDIYQYSDNQPLSDLMAGRLPALSVVPTDKLRPYVFFTIPGDAARDRDAILEHLRLTVSNDSVSDVRIGGVSWHQS